MTPAKSIESPCRKICELDPSRDVCTGCGRTRAEIGRWLSMTAIERRAIMQRLATGPTSTGTSETGTSETGTSDINGAVSQGHSVGRRD